MKNKELIVDNGKLTMEDWEEQKLGKVCDFQNGFAFKSSLYRKNGLPIIRITNIQNDTIDINNLVYFNKKDYKKDLKNYEIHPEDLLIAMSGATTGKIGINNTDKVFYLNQRVGKFKPKENLDKSFLYYFLASKVKESLRISLGAAQPNLSSTQIKNFKIPLPPLPEQRRIVSKLDGLFAEIDASLALIDQNIEQAEALKLSVLDEEFSMDNEKLKIKNWESQNLGNCFRLKSGTNLTRKKMKEDGEYSVFGGNGIAGYYDEYNLSGNNVIIGRVGALCGNVREINENIWLTDNAFKVVDFKYEFDYSFLTYLLNYKNLRNYAKQSAQPVISNIALKNVKLEFPKDIETQQKIVQKLDSLFEEIDGLVSDYQQKREDLEALKSSLLNRAFRGEL